MRASHITYACSFSSSTTRMLDLAISLSGIRLVSRSFQRQLDREDRALAGLTGGVDAPAVFFGDAFGDGKAEPGAAFLGGIIGVKDLVQDIAFHSAAGIGHFDQDVGARL